MDRSQQIQETATFGSYEPISVSKESRIDFREFLLGEVGGGGGVYYSNACHIGSIMDFIGQLINNFYYIGRIT